MDGRQHDRLGLRPDPIDVGPHGTEHEQRQQDPDQPWPGLPAPGQEGRQPRQREQREVAYVERPIVVEGQPEQRRHLHRHHRTRRADDHRQQVSPGPAGHRRSVRVAGQHQLLPQPLRVLPRELARQVIQASHAFHRDQERLVRPQADGHEFGDGTP